MCFCVSLSFSLSCCVSLCLSICLILFSRWLFLPACMHAAMQHLTFLQRWSIVFIRRTKLSTGFCHSPAECMGGRETGPSLRLGQLLMNNRTIKTNVLMSTRSCHADKTLCRGKKHDNGFIKEVRPNRCTKAYHASMHRARKSYKTAIIRPISSDINYTKFKEHLLPSLHRSLI